MDAVQRVKLIRLSLSLGFTLGELERILRVRDRGGAPCRQVRALLSEKMNRLDERIEELIAGRAQFCEVLKSWDQKLSEAPEGLRVNLLESLNLNVALPKFILNKGIRS